MLLQPEGPFGLPDVVETEEAFNFPHQTPLTSCMTKSRTKASHVDTKACAYHEKETWNGYPGKVCCTGVCNTTLKYAPFLKEVR